MEILNNEKIMLTERIERIKEFQRSIPNEDIVLIQKFKENDFDFTTKPVALKDVIFHDKYMYLSDRGTTGIVRALSDEEEYGICIEYIANGQQDILFTHETNKKLYRLP